MLRFILPMIARALRQAAVSLAVVAVVMMSCQIHLDPVEGIHFGSAGVLECSHDDLTGAPGCPESPGELPEDDCGGCHGPTLSLPMDQQVALAGADRTLSRTAFAPSLPDDLTYPPEPPPARLS